MKYFKFSSFLYFYFYTFLYRQIIIYCRYTYIIDIYVKIMDIYSTL